MGLSTRARLPSDLRPTTRECVHLVTRGRFWSRDKDGGHTIRSAVAQKSENGVSHFNALAVGDSLPISLGNNGASDST